MRLTLAPTSALTDSRGHNERPALTAWQRQARDVLPFDKQTQINRRADGRNVDPFRRTAL